ncbi:MAG: hypothetical protein KA715_00335 [Xanthomonadaceae bacterium]|nr:hypothetical protein [Xanthomonadaceae bacterium]
MNALFLLLSLSNVQAQTTYSIPDLIQTIPQGSQKIYVYTQDILIKLKPETVQEDQTELVNRALKEGRAQVSGLALTRVHSETESYTKEMTKNRKQREFQEKYFQKINEITDSNISTRILSKEQSDTILDLRVEFTVSPNTQALAQGFQINERFKEIFHPYRKMSDGTAVVSTNYQVNLGEGQGFLSYPYCISKKQERRKKFMNKICQMAGFNKIVKHRAEGPYQKTYSYYGQDIPLESYIATVKGSTDEDAFLCADLFAGGVHPIKFNPNDLYYPRPYLRYVKSGEYKLTEISCK